MPEAAITRNVPTAAPPRRAARGFTLIELMVVLALLGILITLAAPSFLQFERNSRLRTVSSSLVSAINAARSEAMKRQKYTFITPKNGDWNAGWTVYVDMNSTMSLAPGANDVILSQQTDKPSDIGVTIQTPMTYIMFSGSGFPRQTNGSFANGTFTLTIAGSGETARSVVMANTGRVRSCDPNTDGPSCPDATK